MGVEEDIDKETRSQQLLRMSMSTVFLLLQGALAIVVPQIADIISILGGTVATAMMLLIPAYAMNEVMEPTCKTRTVQVLLYSFAVVSGASVPIKLFQMARVLN